MKNKNLIKTCLLFITISSLTGCNESTNVPNVSEGKDTVISSLEGKPNENESKNVVFATLGKLESYQTYEKVSTNQVNAVKGFINYEQKSDATMIKNGDEYYVDSVSKSAFVDMEHIALSKNNKVAYKDKNSEIKNATYDDYYSVYGVTPNKLLSGQIFNQETILLATLKDTTDGIYTYELVLDMNKANNLIANQTKVFGGLNGLPTYLDHTTFNLLIDENYTPISYTYTAKYRISINVLGDLDCTETCSATFSKYNDEISIPDVDKFANAINETPSKIDVITPESKDPNLVAILNGLTNFDFANGVALNGTINVKNYQIPLKISLQADINALIEEKLDNLSNNLNFGLSFVLPNGEMKLNYCKNAFYVSAFSNKTKFSVRNDNSEETTSFSSEGLFLFTKEDNYYIISLSPLFKDLIFNYLVEVGLFSKEEKSNFLLQIKFYIISDNISSIIGQFGLNNGNSVGFNLMAGNEKYIEPNYEEYSSILSLSYKASMSVMFNSSLVSLPLQFNLSYDDSIKNFANAIELDINASISEIYPILSLVAGFVDNVPSFIKGVVNSNCKYVSLCLRNGSFYGVGYDESNDVKNIRILEELSFDIDVDKLFDNSDIKDTIKLLFAYISSFGKEASKLSDELFIKFVEKLGINKATMALLTTTTGDQIWSKLGFNNPIKSHNFFVDEDGYHYEVTGYKLDTNTVFNPALVSSYETVTLFNFSVLHEGLEVSQESLTELISNNIEMANEVKNLYEDYERLSSDLSIEDEYSEEVNALLTRFNALSDEAKDYATKAYKNSSNVKLSEANIKKLATNFTTNRKRVTEFVDLAQAETPVLSKLNTKYKQLKDFQIKYLLAYYKDSYDIYFTLRANSDASKIETLEGKIDALTNVELSSLSFSELKTRLDDVYSLKNESASYLDGSIDEEKMSKLNDSFNNVLSFYFEYAKSIYKEDMNLITSLDENSSISSFNEVYEKVSLHISDIFKPYDKKSAVFGDYYNDLMTMYKLLDYALTSSTYKSVCFGRNAVFAIEKEIESLVELTSSMTDEQIKNSDEVGDRVNDLKTLREYISLDSSISNLDELTAIENKLA